MIKGSQKKRLDDKQYMCMHLTAGVQNTQSKTLKTTVKEFDSFL